MVIDQRLLIIDDKIQDCIIPLTQDEFFHLEKSIIEDGCRDPLIVWQKSVSRLVIVDGHNRYKICQKHNIPFNYKLIPFDNLEHIKLWMIENQIGRRNLTRDQLSYYRGLKYLSLKKKKGGFENIKGKGQIENSTSLLLSKEFSVSASTITRDAKFAEGINIVNNIHPNLKLKILTGELKISKGQIHALIKSKNPEKILKVLEAKSSERHEGTKSLDSSSIEEERLKKIKGMIISTINRAINNRKKDDIIELKLLIVKLKDELLVAGATPHA